MNSSCASKVHRYKIWLGLVVLTVIPLIGWGAYLRMDHLYNHLDPETLQLDDPFFKVLKPIKFQSIPWRPQHTSEIWLDGEKMEYNSELKVFRKPVGFRKLSEAEISELPRYFLPSIVFTCSSYSGDTCYEFCPQTAWWTTREGWAWALRSGIWPLTLGYEDWASTYRFRWFPESGSLIISIDCFFHSSKVGKSAELLVRIEEGMMVVRDLQDGKKKVLETCASLFCNCLSSRCN